MAVRCEHCCEQLLDFLYGLLDPAEEAALVAHIADCPACTEANYHAQAMKGLFAQAAKGSFPEVKFEIPTEAEPATPTAKPSRSKVWNWAVAATLLIATLGLLVPAIRDFNNHQSQKEVARLETEKLKKLEDEQAARNVAIVQQIDRYQQQIKNLRESHTSELKKWVSAEVAANARPFRLEVTGPVASTPGATNEYKFALKPKIAATITVTVRDSKTTYFTETLPKADEQAWKLPKQLWAKFPEGAEDITLAVTATTDDGRVAELAEPIRLLAPVLSTLVVTDKPLYRPGEAVYFRSLTLNRTNLKPPTRDLTIRFDLKKPDGTVLDGSTIIGTAQPVMDQDGMMIPLRTEDGEPIRGIACGVIKLPETIPGGEYTLIAHELPPGWASKELPANATPIGTRKLTVAMYAPEKLEKTLEFDAKTYSPGDTVKAKLTVKKQGKPQANRQVIVTAKHGNGLAIPTKAAMLDANGSATIALQLPNNLDLNNVTLTANILDENAETIVRSVPLATKTLSLEFFPEGGDLIEGIANRVYFRATTTTGKPADVAGIITDGTRDIGEAKTLTDAENPGVNQGLGVFSFTPEAGKRYSLKLVRPVGIQAPANGYTLPKAETNGVVLSIPNGVIDANQPLKATVTSKTKRNLIVGAYTRGFTIGHRRITVDANQPTEVTIDAPKTAIGGVTRVTVFEEPAAENERVDLVPLAERLMFRRPTEQLKLQIQMDRNRVAPGEKVTLSVKATDEKGRPTTAIILAAVVNQSVIAMADDKAERRLPTHFLLNGELEKPEQLEHADFLLTPHPKAAETLDLLLGTQGWRRFAEADGRFRSQAASDAEKKQFWISTGMQDVMAVAARPESLTRKHLESTEPLDTKLDQLEAEKKAAERERDRKSPEWGEQKQASDQAARDLRIARGNSELIRARFIVLLVSVGIVAVIYFCGLMNPAETFVIAAILFILNNLLLPADQKVREAALRAKAANDAKVAMDDRPLTADLRDGLPRSGTVQVRTILADASPRSDIGKGSPSKIRVASFDNQPRSDRADRAALNLRETGPPTYDEEKALDRVRAALKRHSSFIVREYAHRPILKSEDETRSDFTETVLWHPVLVLPNEGKATLDFHVSDAVNAYRVMVAGHTLDGRLGATTDLLQVTKPLSVDVKLPLELSLNDRVELPIIVNNSTLNGFDAKLGYWSDFLIADSDDFTTQVPAAAGTRRVLRVKPIGLGAARVRVSAAGGGHTDALERSTNIVPEGFPIAGTANGQLAQKLTATLDIPADLVPGTLRVKLNVFTNSLADIQSGLEGMLREPLGCFEQTSSANYPNILALQYLQDANSSDLKLSEAARALLQKGYEKLAGFEVPRPNREGREGFEWFGKYPAHEPLTAYGLVQFNDMARVFPVDPKLVNRTRNFLLTRRDGNGGFTRLDNAHSFGGVPANVANAYISWAIRESDPNADIAKEVDAVIAEAMKSDDSYRLALAANASKNAEVLQALAKKQHPDGSIAGAETSITRSRGNDLTIETTALAALAFQKTPEFAGPLREAMKFLVQARRPHGDFGGTQATVLALKAIVAYNQANRREPETGEIIVKVDGQECGPLAFRNTDLKTTTLEFENAEKLFAPGKHEIVLETQAKQNYPVTVAWSAMSRKPESAKNPPVKLTTTLTEKMVVEGDGVRLNIRIENRTDGETGMAVAVVGLPAGVKLPTDMKQLKDSTKISFWELRGRELVLYWRSLKSKEVVELPLDLIAEIPGEFHGPASRAYLYYGADEKQWLEPLAISITRK